MRPLRDRADDESGMTMVELVVSMGVLTVVLVMILGFLVPMQKAVNTEVSRSLNNDEARLAAQQLDRHIRSGNVLFSPTAGGYQLRIYTQANATQKCVEWRVASRRLEWRSWVPASIDPAPWKVVANNIVNADESVAPFAYDTSENAQFGNRIVRISLLAREKGQGSPSRIDLSVAGRNTQYGFTSSTGICDPAPAAA